MEKCYGRRNIASECISFYFLILFNILHGHIFSKRKKKYIVIYIITVKRKKKANEMEFILYQGVILGSCGFVFKRSE